MRVPLPSGFLSLSLFGRAVIRKGLQASAVSQEAGDYVTAVLEWEAVDAFKRYGVCLLLQSARAGFGSLSCIQSNNKPV